jgi:hypothetical protein
MTLPTYADLEPKIRAWAAHRQITYADGRPRLGTIAGQYAKMLEEIAEAQDMIREWSICQAMGDDACPKNKAEVRQSLALEFGDVLVTLVLLSAMHGMTLDACLLQAPRLPRKTPQEWQFINEHAKLLGDRLGRDVGPMIGAVARCVEDESRITLELSGPECLALALTKIEGRDGVMIDGVFVKSAVTV